MSSKTQSKQRGKIQPLKTVELGEYQKMYYQIYMYKPQECQRQKGCCWNIYVTTLDYTLSSVHGYIFILPARTPFGRWELFRMAPRGHVQTLMLRTWERRQASYRFVRRGRCRSIKMRVLETEWTSSPHKTHFQKSFWHFVGLAGWCA